MLSPRVTDLSVELGGELLAICGQFESTDEGARALKTVLRDGRAAEKFAQMVAAQGGPNDLIDRSKSVLPVAPVIGDVTAPMAGYISRIDGQAVGLAVINLGGGRMREDDKIDPSVGFSSIVRLGQRIELGEPLGQVHAASEDAAQMAAEALRSAVEITELPVEPPELIIDRITR